METGWGSVRLKKITTSLASSTQWRLKCSQGHRALPSPGQLPQDGLLQAGSLGKASSHLDA